MYRAFINLFPILFAYIWGLILPVFIKPDVGQVACLDQTMVIC